MRILLFLLLLCPVAVNAQTVHWQARMNDSCTVVFHTLVQSEVTIGRAVVAKRGTWKREEVQCRNLTQQVESMMPLTFTFACDFEYKGLRYRLRGHFTDSDNNGANQTIRCIPLTLGEDFIEQGGRGNTRR